MADTKLTPDEKIENIAQQMRACEIGALQELACPYCGSINTQGQPLCCNLFAAAALAIMQREDARAQLEMADRIAEKALRN
jgi:hypothetical protein